MVDHAANADDTSGLAAGGFDPARWRKALSSEPNGGNCVEVNFLGPGVGVRDSKLVNSPVFVFRANAWRAFVGAVKAGRSDRPGDG